VFAKLFTADSTLGQTALKATLGWFRLCRLASGSLTLHVEFSFLAFPRVGASAKNMEHHVSLIVGSRRLNFQQNFLTCLILFFCYMCFQPRFVHLDLKCFIFPPGQLQAGFDGGGKDSPLSKTVA